MGNLKDMQQVTLVAENQRGSVGAATWNHDGTGIYFSSEISGDSQIYQLNIASGAIKQITSKGGIMAFPGVNKSELYILKPHQVGLYIYDMQTNKEQMLVESIKSELHRSIHVKPSGIYYASTEGQVKKYDFSSQQTIDIDIGIELMVPVLTVSDDETWFAYPYYNQVENSIYQLSQQK